jgi:endonuclease III
MNMEKLEPFEALVAEMDDKMISGKLEVTHDTMRLISALRLVIRDSSTTRMQAIMRQSDLMDECERLEEEVDEKADEIRALRRQMGIWRAKAKRLEAAA